MNLVAMNIVAANLVAAKNVPIIAAFLRKSLSLADYILRILKNFENISRYSIVQQEWNYFL